MNATLSRPTAPRPNGTSNAVGKSGPVRDPKSPPAPVAGQRAGANASRSSASAPPTRAPVSTNPKNAPPATQPAADRPDHTILFQSFFKSVGPRTYVAQLKRASNDNHYLVLTEGRRDKESGEIRKNRINIFSEDFDAFFNLLRDAARFIKDHPLPPEFVAKRKAFWNKTRRPRQPRREPSRS